MKITRRATLALLSAVSALALSGLFPTAAQEGSTHDQAKLLAATQGVADHEMGSETAPVTVIEYASPTCPHCATFHNQVFPAFKSAYIDTGKVRFILRPFVRNVPDAVVFMLAHATGPDNFHNVIETYFRTQESWAASQTPRAALEGVATQLGFTKESFDAALTNQELFNAMEAMREQALEEFRLEGTPTFYVNGKQLTGDKTLEQLAAEIDPLVPADFQATAPAAEEPAASPMAAEPVAPAETPAQ